MAKKALRGVLEYKQYDIPLSKVKSWVIRDGKMVGLAEKDLEKAEAAGETLYSEEELAKKFYHEYYAKDLYGEDVILSEEVHRKEAHRNNYALYADAFNAAKNIDGLKELTEDQRKVLEMASDLSDYELAYKQGGPELAYQVIMDQSVRDLKSGIDPRVVLSRYHVKMNKVKRQHNKEKRK